MSVDKLPGHCNLLIKYCDDWPYAHPIETLARLIGGSRTTHCEVAFGNQEGSTISNVCRIFNDEKGVELVERTAGSSLYTFVQIHCTKRQELRMLSHAHSLIGRPFSNYAMLCSVFSPRITDESSFFCAELVATLLRTGGILQPHENPGSYTPHGYKGGKAHSPQRLTRAHSPQRPTSTVLKVNNV